MPTLKQIDDATEAIVHDHDGPVTAHIAVWRALKLAAAGADPEMLADILLEYSAVSFEDVIVSANPRAY